MFNYSKIAYLLNKNKVTKIQLCAKIDMTTQGYDKMVRNNTMKVETLEKIAEFFNIGINFFFHDNNTLNEPDAEYSKENYKKKYYKLLEENREINQRLWDCLKELENKKE